MGPGTSSLATGGEVTGVGGTAYSEPTPYGMVMVKKGALKIGTEETDTLWGTTIPTKECRHLPNGRTDAPGMLSAFP